MKYADVPVDVLTRSVTRAAGALGIPASEVTGVTEALVEEERLRWLGHSCWDESAAISQAWGHTLGALVASAENGDLTPWICLLGEAQP